MAKPTFTQKDRFRYLSESAAKLERQGQYDEASKAWNTARKIASQEDNRLWCLNRSEFCERMAERPF